ncbi:MAG: hypothetical protein GZ093_15745 [Rhodoferax sp.]|uniref:hypothetical protein n=1 Tax=Rhodoferax sp. TaxID=50421 RepID=UPI0013FEADA6|nr:hypothetical protein [Rhodoferax sp.]NDP40175.1 hypothetical protein [Rhodoferax sp.]
MLEKLFNKLADDGSAEFIYLIIGSLLLFVYQRVRSAIRQFGARRKLRNDLSAYLERKGAINVIDIANGDPEFAKSNIFVREVTNFGRPKSLFISMSDEHQAKLRSRQIEAGYGTHQCTCFQPDESFNGSGDFSELAVITDIADLPILIEKHRIIVSEKFVHGTDGMMFNGEKYGVFNLRFTRFGFNEAPGVELDLFHTDYFTHRVFRSIYQELKGAGHPIAQASVENFLQYRPFFTSFGVNALLICEGERGREIVLGKRSARVHGSSARYHVTMNEGLSQTDKDAFGRVDLELCFKRGLLEELGIDDKLYCLAKRSAFYDFFLERNNLEIGLSAVFELDVGFAAEIEPLVARDKAYEADGFETLPLKHRPIRDFVGQNEFVPHGLYVIEHVLMREGISISSIGKAVV